MTSQSSKAVITLIKLIVSGQFGKAEEVTHGVRLSAAHLAEAVREYGRTLTLPPGERFDLDVIEVADRQVPTWSVRYDMWTKEEGRSDLTIELTVEEKNGFTAVEIDNFHVL